MSVEQSLKAPQSTSRKKVMIGVIIFTIVTIIGLFWVKWDPYFHKVFTAAQNHSIGTSILSGGGANPPKPSFMTAWNYALQYFQSIWKAFIVGIILASLIQVLLPTNWIQKVLGKTSYGSTFAAGMSALPGMMCTCCSAPIVVGLRRQQSSVAAAIAFWFGNTALNPAVLIFMFFVLGWKFTVLRLILGIVLVFGVSYLVGRMVQNKDDACVMNTQTQTMINKGNKNTDTHFLLRWLRSLGTMSLAMIPAYIISVFVLGAFRAWLFPALGGTIWGNGLLAILLFAIAGTLFVIPTAGEIPIVQTLMNFGLGMGPAATLMITLPAISVPSALMVRKALSWRTLLILGISVAIVGVIAGLIGMLWL